MDNQWRRLIFHILDELDADEADPISAERAAVHVYIAIHRRLEEP